jgi:precorrin-8X/cobalt-precorrin-8 methylmutase
MRVVHSVGDPLVAQHMRISTNACAAGRKALHNHQAILCDVEMVKQGITKRMIQNPPLCYLNHEDTTAIAQLRGETRSMAALDLWGDQLAASVVVIGNAPTALFRLLEMIKAGVPKPALIVGIPVGFVGAAESKKALWDIHEELGIECITLLGRQGGSAAASSVVNALLRCNIGERY